MKYFIISDIHSNLEALTATLATLRDETLMVLGDVIGYGADPKACIEIIRNLDVPCFMGNHDNVQLDLTNLRYFNPLAKESTLYTKSCLSDADIQWIRSLPTERIMGKLYFNHGSPYDPEGFHYLMPQDLCSTWLQLSFFRMVDLAVSVAFIGHTHLPGYFTDDNGSYSFTPLTAGDQVTLDPSKRYIINSGSVGQPRNHDCNAQFLVFDDETSSIEMHSVPYDIDKTTAKIKAAGLPHQLGERLYLGI